MTLRGRLAASAAAVLLCGSAASVAVVDAFQPTTLPSPTRSARAFPTCSVTRTPMAERDVIDKEEEEGGDALLFSDEWEDGVPPPPSDADAEDDGPEAGGSETAPRQKNARWNSLNPYAKRRIVEEARERAARNKKRREPAADRKRRAMMFYKEKQRQKRKDARVRRPVPLGDDRTPLSSLSPGDELTGTVISLTNFGAYVDVGTECDGLLHVSQMSREVFVNHPREVLRPGEEVTVRVVRASPELKKLQLTMLDESELRSGNFGVGGVASTSDPDDDDDDESGEDPILLSELALDDELWGEIVRVTAYGSYVELGAEVEGFLHFMDHPEFDGRRGDPPSEYMSVGDRVRVWVSDLDEDRTRIKLTANRPGGLPGPRREMRRDCY